MAPSRPNRLAGLLRYFSDAWAYAKASIGEPARRGPAMLTDIVQEMGRLGAYGEDVVDTEAAYTLAVTTGAVYSAIKLVADRASDNRATYEVKRREGGSLVDLGNHPMEVLLDTPNPLMSGSFLRRYLVWWYLLRGNAYLFVGTPEVGRGAPIELWPLIADQVRPRPDLIRRGTGAFTGKLVIDYEYRVNGRPEYLPGENVVHFRTPNPFDFWEGLSPLTPLLVTLQSDSSQARWVRDFFDKKNAVPTAIISVPPTTTPADFEDTRMVLREQFEKGQRTLLTRAGDLSVSVIQQTMEQLQVLNSRVQNTAEIDRIYGIPHGILTEGMSGDSRLAAEVALARNTVQPMVDYFAQELSSNLAPFYGPDLVVTAPNVVPQDRSLEAQEYGIYGQDMTINELRRSRELPNSEHPWANIPVRLLQLPQGLPPVPGSVGELEREAAAEAAAAAPPAGVGTPGKPGPNAEEENPAAVPSPATMTGSRAPKQTLNATAKGGNGRHG